jgi:hypothetical protein
MRKAIWNLIKRLFERELFWEKHRAFCEGWRMGCDCCYIDGQEGGEKTPPPPAGEPLGMELGNRAAKDLGPKEMN